MERTRLLHERNGTRSRCYNTTSLHHCFITVSTSIILQCLVLLMSTNYFIVVVVHGEIVEYEWTLTSFIDKSGLRSPDCLNNFEERRSMFVANNSFPGPTIEAMEGDTIIIKIKNDNPGTAASIHFHGIHQKGTPYTDGAAFVTQCALGPLQSQEYEFMAYPPGTHYWHDHTSYNIADGLSGTIIIHPADPDPFEYDDERVIFLQDWYIENGIQQHDGLNSWPFVWIGNPNSLLINGKGIAPECQEGGPFFNNSLRCLPSCLADPVTVLSTINVTALKTYRLRIINAGQLVMMNFAIDQHNMTIVQVEGTNVEPLLVTSIDVAPGQRYDVLLTTTAEPGTYLMETIARRRQMDGLYGRALLVYDTGTLEYPTNTTSLVHPIWNDTVFGIEQDLALKTLDPQNYATYSVLNATDITRYVVVGTQNEYHMNGAPTLLRWAMNNISNIHHSTPLIGKAVMASRNLGWPTSIDETLDVPYMPPMAWNYSDLVNISGGPGPMLGHYMESIVQLEDGQVVEFVLQNALALNGVAEFHPWHMHGHSFWIVGYGEGTYDPDIHVAEYNLVNPVLRDTLVLHPLGWVALRFEANNPGAWVFHCHIVAHHVMGMGFNMIVQPDKLDTLPENVDACDAHQLDFEPANTSTTNGIGSGSDKRFSSYSTTMYRYLSYMVVFYSCIFWS